MAFACQRNSYQKTLRTTVVSSKPSTLSITRNGKKEDLKGFDVILNDTILFPEGGGQPDDHGTIGGYRVLRVTRNGLTAVHFMFQSFESGEIVDVEVDWNRRFDHMQQHSGQHLITAVADNLFGYNTTSWNLGETVSSIELDIQSIPIENVNTIEEVVNQNIRDCIPVNVKVYEEGAEELKQARTRGLPEDYKGPVRIITIEGIESNMCCGTHIKNLADLQMIKLLYTEKGKKNKTNLFFVAGNRVLKYLQTCYEREKKFTSLLKGGPDQHVELLEKIQRSLKVAQKNELNLMRDLASMEARNIKNLDPKPKYFSLHRKEGNSDFMSIITSEVNDETILLFLTVGDEKGSGQVLISGQPEVVAKMGPKVGEILEGKGAAKGNRYQGKVNNMAQRSKAEECIKNFLQISDEEEINFISKKE